MTAWATRCNTVHPLIAQAVQDGCLSTGTLDDLGSARGISLACTTNAVVVITPLPPPRPAKYHLAQESAHLRMSPDGIKAEGAEHIAIGDSACLYFFAGGGGMQAAKVPLVLPNGLQLTYGQILALGGDFYGIPSAPISDGATLPERMSRFTNAYNTLAVDAGALDEAPKILAVMENETRQVDHAVAAGDQPSSAYKELGDELSRQWNVITGGGSIFSSWIPLGRYMQLAAVSWDHFGQHAVDSYVAGHTVAMQQARLARNAPQAQQQPLLRQAYAMNAFADHFLSDLFSAGHVRAPRKELYDKVTPSLLGSSLLRYMHDEDSCWGLNVVTGAGGDGNSWHTYGDKRYFDAVGLAYKNQVNAAVQASVREVFEAFDLARITPPSQMAALDMTPYPLGSARDLNDEEAKGNISPLFAVVNSTLVRRNHVNNLNDYTWTRNWWGWSTLLLLMGQNSSHPQGYPLPPAAAPTVDPNGWQSSQAVRPDWGKRAQVRYAVSFVAEFYESDPGRWCGYVNIGPNQACPTLTGVPIGPDGTLGRRIYRQFEREWYTNVGQLQDNTTTTFVDDCIAGNES